MSMKKILFIFTTVIGLSLLGGVAFAAPETSGLVFDKYFTSGGKTFFTDIKPQTSVKLTDGSYDLRVLVGFYGNLADMNSTEFSGNVRTGYTVSYKKENTTQYIGQIAVDTSTSDITIPNYTGEAYTALHSSFKTSQSVDPGKYVVDVIYASKIIETVDVCLPTFTSSAGNSKGNETCGVSSVDLDAGAQQASTTNPGTYEKTFDITPNNALASATSVILRVTNSVNQQVSDTPVTLPAGTLTTSPTVEDLVVGNYTAAVYQGALKISATVVFKISATSPPQTTTFTISSTGQASAGNNTFVKTLEVVPSAALQTSFPVQIHYGADVPDDGSLPNGTVSAPFSIPAGANGGDFDTVALDPGDYDAAVFVGNTRISNKITFTVAGSAATQELFKVGLEDVNSVKKLPNGSYYASYTIETKDQSVVGKTYKFVVTYESEDFINGDPVSFKAETTSSQFENDDLEEHFYKMAVLDSSNKVVSNISKFIIDPDGVIYAGAKTKFADAKDDKGKGTDDKNSKVTKDGKLKSPLGDKYDTIEEIIVAIMNNLVIPIAVPIVILAIIYTGWLFIAARGNDKKISEAKQAALYTAIGGAVVLGAWVAATAIKGTVDEIRGTTTARIEHVEKIDVDKNV